MVTYCLGNPIKLVDSDGELSILPILWAIYEFGSTAYDIYQTGKTLADGNASTEEKVVAFAGTATGLFMPGGGYGTAGKVAVKVADKANDVSKIATKVDDGVKAVENVNINVTPVNEKTYQTYTKLNPKTGEVYSGRTSGNGTPEENILKRDKNHHMNKFGFGPAILDKSSSNKNAIRRVQEQILINNNGGAKSFWGKFWQ
ncbi:MAG: hypothetical protein IKL19_04430 [Paludibacteraceae bacterium]|nr:hypothetical protein [Paludibacteraceae bacterium]